MAMARCVLPVPVPPTRTTLRCWAMNPPPARSPARASLIGVSLKVKSSTSLASGSFGDGELVFDRARLRSLRSRPSEGRQAERCSSCLRLMAVASVSSSTLLIP